MVLWSHAPPNAPLSPRLTTRLCTQVPFLVLSAWGVANGDFDATRLLQRPPGGVKWGSMLSVVFWSLEGFDNASTFAGEVDAHAQSGRLGLLFYMPLPWQCHGWPPRALLRRRPKA